MELKQILISHKQPDFIKKLIRLRFETMQASMFGPGDDRAKQLNSIIYGVAGQGDKAVAEYTEKFDGVKLTPEQFRVSQQELKKAHAEIKSDEPELWASILQAIENVRKYQEEIFIGNKKQNKHPGIKYTPITRVGICVPGASAPLPSTVVMTAVPAQVAGVREIAVVSPPRHNGSIHPVILAVCCELKITEVYRIGGAQAVAALAFSTETINNVNKIVGPGNQWVQMAKRTVFGMTGIDSVAGPSEVLIIANEQANPVWIAADMLSQAEHAPGSAILFTNSQKFAEKVVSELEVQLAKLARAEEIGRCLEKYGKIAVFENLDDIVEWANRFASEHLEIQCGEKNKKIADKIENAGAIFIGDYSPVAVGDYWAGPSHVLPTAGGALFSSALSANDFIKATSIIEYSKKQLTESAGDIIRLAEIEGLDAHAKSVKVRTED